MIFSELIMQTCSKLELTFAVDLTQRQVANIDNFVVVKFYLPFTFFNQFGDIAETRSRFNILSNCRISGKVRRPKTDILSTE